MDDPLITPEPIFLANTHMLREAWLKEAVEHLRPMFKRIGLTIPEKLRVGFGLMSQGRKSNAIGQCWYSRWSADQHIEIFISPLIDDPIEVLGILVHELVHACLPDDARHGPKFKAGATSIGLVGPMRHARPGPLLEKPLADIAAFLGPLPHARLNIRASRLDQPHAADVPKKQGTRMLKAECCGNLQEPCGYTIRLAAKWARLGALCPTHGAMKVVLPSGEIATGSHPDPPDEDV